MAQIFESDKHLDILTKKFLNSLDSAIIKCFRKVRKTKGKPAKIVDLYSRRAILKEHIGNNHDEEIHNIESQIADEACNIIQAETNGLDSETGGYNPGHMWRLKDKNA